MLDKVVEAKPEVSEAVEHYLQSPPNMFPDLAEQAADYEEEPEDLANGYTDEEQHFDEEADQEEYIPDDAEVYPSDGEADATDEYAAPFKRYSSFNVSEEVSALATMSDLDIISPEPSEFSDDAADCRAMERSDSGVHFTLEGFDEAASPQPSPTLSIASVLTVDMEELELENEAATSVIHSDPIRISSITSERKSSNLANKRESLVIRGQTADTGLRNTTMNAYSRADFTSTLEEDDDDDFGSSRSFLRPATTSRVRVGSL